MVPRNPDPSPGAAAVPQRWRAYLALLVVIVTAILILAALQLAPPPKTYSFTLVAGIGGTLTFNDTTPGPSMTVPQGAHVRVTLTVSSAASGAHSWMLVPLGGTPASTVVFPGASTMTPSTGLAPGTSQTVAFVATTAGSYKYICGVDSHYLEMYGSFNVTG